MELVVTYMQLCYSHFRSLFSNWEMNRLLITEAIQVLENTNLLVLSFRLYLSGQTFKEILLLLLSCGKLLQARRRVKSIFQTSILKNSYKSTEI